MTNETPHDADSARSTRTRDRATGMLVLVSLLAAGIWLGVKVRHAAVDTSPAVQSTN